MSLWTRIKKNAEMMQDIFSAAAFAEAGERETARRIAEERRASIDRGRETLRREALSRRMDRPTLR
jgi:hypothetical protein